MITESHTLRLDGPIPPSLRSLFLSCIGIDVFGSAGRGANTSYGSIGGGDDASCSGQRDTNDDSTSRGGADMSQQLLHWRYIIIDILYHDFHVIYVHIYIYTTFSIFMLMLMFIYLLLKW